MKTIKRKITISSVAALQPGQTLWDTELPGFSVRCQTRAKSYSLKCRVGGKQALITIGKHGAPWTPDQARREAKRLIGEIASGNDPRGKRQQRTASETVNTLAAAFLAEHVEARRKPKTYKDYQSLINRIILPALGKRKVCDVTHLEVEKLHTQLRHTPYQANRALAVLRKMFNFAEKRGERALNSNPCRHVEKYPEKSRERFLSGSELARLGNALRKAENGENTPAVSPQAIAALRLLLFTGARLNEILTLQWEWINFETGEARLPDSKTGEKTLHLPPEAMEILHNLPRLTGNPFVIAGQRQGAHLVNLQKPWRTIRAAAGLEDVRLHDLRHSFASVGAASGLGLPILSHLLGHSQTSTTERYMHFASAPAKAGVARIAETVNEYLSAITDP